MKTKALVKRISFFALLLAIGVGFGISARLALADASKSGLGWSWGGGVMTNPIGYDGMGWTSFNNISDGSVASYGVNVPSADGPLSGYAWSDGYGWISFNGADLTGCAPALAQANRTGNAITGGARIVAIRDAIATGNAGGFDGCINLSGTAADNSTYGVSISGTTLTGYAWSSDLGWIDFENVLVQYPAKLLLCPASTTIQKSQQSHFFAYCGAGITDCNNVSGAIDETASLAWTSGDPSKVSVSNGYILTGVNTTSTPITITATGTGTGLCNGIAPINPSTNTNTVSVNVVCVPSCPADTSPEAQAVCSNQTYTYHDAFCNADTTCNGGRYCDFNWKEVRP